MAATDQIRQMVNFILQEAHEKANEIRVKVCFVVTVHRVLVRMKDINGEGLAGKWMPQGPLCRSRQM
jgi:hypothetical protein